MPILDEHSLDFWSHSAEQTRRFGARLGELLLPGDLVTLSGELGAGKTTFMAGIGHGWGSSDQVTSPTFVLVNDYRRPDGLHLWHLDCYRLNSGAEALALGFDDLLASGGIMVVEWPERIADVLPAERLRLDLRWVDDTRRGLRLEAGGALTVKPAAGGALTNQPGAGGTRYQTLLDDFRRSAFGS
jgi:tRNA threonylcarbamoyladenosine biosynthesis protein TsaE